MKPKSNNLFHFTKSLDVLKLILKNGIQPRYCLEDNEWMGLGDNKHIAFPMSCFCDIPLSRISEHTDFYGNFGLGFTKEWGLKNQLNPIIYTTSDGRIQNLMKFLFSCNRTDENKEDFDFYTYSLWVHMKPIVGNMIISGEVVEKEFYQENEWRYVPPVDTLILADKFENSKDDANKKVSEHALKFVPSDIRYLFVKSDSDIPALVDFINTELGHFPHNDLKILTSRIVSLETLHVDL